MKFRFTRAGEVVEEVELSDCTTVEQAVNSRYGSAAPFNLDCTIINQGENDVEGSDQPAEADSDGRTEAGEGRLSETSDAGSTSDSGGVSEIRGGDAQEQ